MQGIPGWVSALQYMHYRGCPVRWSLVAPAVSNPPQLHCFTSSTWELGHTEPLLECTVYFCINGGSKVVAPLHIVAIHGCWKLHFL